MEANGVAAGAAPIEIGHTPGPWLQSHRRTCVDAWNTQVYDKSGRTIATLDWYPVNLSGGIVGSAREANARLIAASPDMQSALSFVASRISDHGKLAASPETLTEWAAVIRAALSKAGV